MVSHILGPNNVTSSLEEFLDTKAISCTRKKTKRVS